MKLPSHKRLGRRDLIQWLGSAALALPYLELLEGTAGAQTVAKKAKYLVLLYTPDGVNNLTFWPKGTETAFTLSPILSPFEPFKDKIIVLGPKLGTNGMPNDATGLTYNAKPPQHRAAVTTTATSQSLPLHDPQTDVVNKIDGPSIDQVVAKAVQGDSLLPSLEFGIHPIGGDTPSDINYRADGTPITRLEAPDEAWSRVFGMAAPVTAGGPVDMSAVHKQQALTDFLNSSFSSLQPLLSSYDRHVLDGHLTSLKAFEDRKARILAMQSDPKAGCTQPMRRAVPTDDTSVRTGADTQQLAPFFNDLISASFACNITKVASVTFGYPGGGGAGGLRMPWLGFTDPLHGISHHNNDATKLDKYTKMHNWIASQVADLMTKLAAVKTATGTLLDETTLYWFNRHGDGNGHTNFALPNVILGGCGGYFKMGRNLSLPGTSPTKVLISLATSLGVDVPSFGSGAMKDTSPLAGLTA
jgi:Protein of unknown function (DUF1552)